MPLNNRLLSITLGLPTGPVVIDQSIKIHVRAKKNALAIQNSATVEVYGLTTSLRASIMSQFTAFRNNQVQPGNLPAYFVPITISAGYQTSASSSTSIIYKGQVVFADPLSGPPDIGVQFTCYTRQIDRSTIVTNPAPSPTTFKEYVMWAASQMGIDPSNVIFQATNYSNLQNMSTGTYQAAALIWDIQGVNNPNVSAYIDDDLLIVKDLNSVIDPSNITPVAEFIGIPSWKEWGVAFETLFDQNIRLGHAVSLTSVMNPSLNGQYVITELDYDLASREGPFYVKAQGSPPAHELNI